MWHFMGTHLRAPETGGESPRPYGIKQCYQPLNTGARGPSLLQPGRPVLDLDLPAPEEWRLN